MNQADLSQYRKDARGNLVPVANIKPVDLARDELIEEVFAAVIPKQQELAALKQKVMADVNAFVDISVEQYGVKRSVKGNTTLTSFDGSRRIVIANQDVLHFDERIQAAKALIDECLNEWSENSRPELKTIVQKAFDVNKEGKINVQRVLSLKNLDISDAKWQRAMQALTDSLHTQTTREYIRFYVRKEGTEEYELVNMDFAKV